MRRRIALGLALSVAALCAACSSSGGGSSNSGSAGGGTPASGTYDIWNFTDVPDDPAVVGTKAGIDALNAAGGVNGHKLVLKSCVTKGDANVATTCARNAANDANALASVGSFTEDGSAVNPILVKGGLPILAPDLDTTSDFTSTNIFSPDVGGAAINGQQAIMLQVMNVHQAGEINGDYPANHLLQQTTDQLLACQGAPRVKAAFTPAASADFSPGIASLGKVDVLFIILPTADIGNAATTARQLGYTYPLMMGGLGSGKALDQVPNRGTVYRPGYFNTSSQGYKDYEKAMGSQAGTDSDTNTSGQGYLGMMMVKYAADKLGSKLSKTSIVSLFQKTTDFNYEDMAPTANFTVKNQHLGGAQPNLVVPYVYAQQLMSNDTFKTLNGGKALDIYGSHAPSAKC